MVQPHFSVRLFKVAHNVSTTQFAYVSRSTHAFQIFPAVTGGVHTKVQKPQKRDALALQNRKKKEGGGPERTNARLKRSVRQKV
mmetsp:Transcript_15387/g.33100  ORF Transcript_15387/g.33100 Transcript_15387/m.33100 type:complete len:84 (+) Transcript_15387:1128-1379(+)